MLSYDNLTGNAYGLEDGTLHIPVPRKLTPATKPIRYKALHGGRGSGKSHFFAEQLIDHHMRYPGLRSVCVREVQRSLSQSSKALIEKKIDKYDLYRFGFKVFFDRIQAPGGGLILFQGMSDHTAESIKSLEGCGIAWVEEAQTLSERSLELLRPTIRDSGIREFEAEIWFSWNPSRKADAVDKFFRKETPQDAVVIEVNYWDNPWFPDVLEQERLEDEQLRPHTYDHIWNGGYIKAQKGAYFVKNLNKAKEEKRICNLPEDPLLHCHAYWDIGGTGAKADACVIWVVQFAGRAINVIDHYKAQGQELKDHIYWLRQNGYTPERCNMILPHDGVKHGDVNRVTYRSVLQDNLYKVEIIPNAGQGAAMMRIEAVRKEFHRIWFDKTKCEEGLEALGWYHPKRSKVTDTDLGPEHDWSSHDCDAFGMMAVHSSKSTKQKPKKQGYRPTPVKGGWLGA